MNHSGKYLIWTLLSVVGAFALGYIALNRGEQINALWIVVAAVCIYLIAYRFYGLYIAKNVLAVDPTRMTPAVRHNDGLDYHMPEQLLHLHPFQITVQTRMYPSQNSAGRSKRKPRQDSANVRMSLKRRKNVSVNWKTATVRLMP